MNRRWITIGSFPVTFTERQASQFKITVFYFYPARVAVKLAVPTIWEEITLWEKKIAVFVSCQRGHLFGNETVLKASPFGLIAWVLWMTGHVTGFVR